MGFFSYKHPIMARVYAYSHKYTLNPESTFKLIKTIVNLPKSAFVLDVGGGTGTHAEFFVGEGHKVVVLDPSKEMLAFIRNKTIIKRVGTANNLPFENNSFDLVYCTDAFHHFSNGVNPKNWSKLYDVCVRELLRVVKKGGKIAIAEFNPSCFRSRIFMFLEKPFGSCFFTAEQMTALFKKAGFDVKIHKYGFQYLAVIKK